MTTRYHQKAAFFRVIVGRRVSVMLFYYQNYNIKLGDTLYTLQMLYNALLYSYSGGDPENRRVILSNARYDAPTTTAADSKVLRYPVVVKKTTKRGFFFLFCPNPQYYLPKGFSSSRIYNNKHHSERSKKKNNNTASLFYFPRFILYIIYIY